MSIRHRSSSGSPSTIQSASSRPMPAAPAIPCAQNPAATKSPRTADSPRMNSLSGVKASGPLIIRLTPTLSIAVMLDLDAGDPAVLDADADDTRARSDAGTASPGAGRERLGQPGRIQPAVGRQEDCAVDAIDRHQREQPLRLLRGDELQREAE